MESRSARKKRKKNKTLRRVLFSFLALVLLVVGYSGFKVMNTLNDMYNAEASNKEDIPIDPVKKKANESFTVLLLGSDSRTGEDLKEQLGRTDTIILAAFNPEYRKVSLLSIPRDAYVEIAGQGRKTKMNHAYQYGIGTIMKTVENFLMGVPVDYYAAINFTGFKQLIDEIGGVEINVEKRMVYHALDVDIDLYPGLQVLNGDEALQYARFRADAEGDFGRNRRQQEVIQAVAEQATSLRNVKNIFSMLDILGGNVSHNIPSRDLIRMARQFKDVTGRDIESMGKIKGTDTWTPVYYYMVEEGERQRLRDELTARLDGSYYENGGVLETKTEPGDSEVPGTAEQEQVAQEQAGQSVENEKHAVHTQGSLSDAAASSSPAKNDILSNEAAAGEGGILGELPAETGIVGQDIREQGEAVPEAADPVSAQLSDDKWSGGAGSAAKNLLEGHDTAETTIQQDGPMEEEGSKENGAVEDVTPGGEGSVPEGTSAEEKQAPAEGDGSPGNAVGGSSVHSELSMQNSEDAPAGGEESD